MIIKKPLTKLAISVLLTLSPTISLANISQDIINTINSRPTNPIEVWNFVKRRINEWSIGVTNPDYVPNFRPDDYTTKYSDYEFKNVAIFGDSLSDKGTRTRSTMFLAGGYHSKLYNDYLSEYYTGKNSVPHTYGGVNYAEAGSTLKDKGNNLHIRKQIDAYLEKFGGVADPDNIYILNAGAMDINKSIDKIIAGLIKGTYRIDSEFYTIDDAPKEAADNIIYLREKGAKYIMIGNIPDASLAPYIPLIPFEVVTEILDRFHLPNFGIITHVGKLIDNHLRNPSNQVPGTGEEMIRLNGIHTLQSIFWFIPHPIVINMHNFLSAIQREPTAQFNRSLELELSKIGGDLVFFDSRKLLTEIINDYRSYGIDDILVPTCDLGFSSRYCDYDSPHYHKDRVYAMGDWFHPSPESHFIVAQYIQSIFDAPLYITSLSEQFSNVNFSKNNFLEGQLFDIKQTPNKELDQWHLIIGYSGMMNDKSYKIHHLTSKKTFTHNLNIGAYTFSSPDMALGFMFTTSLGKQKPFHNFRYNYVSESITLFSEWSNTQGLWFNAMLDFGFMRIKDIKRQIQLGASQRTEKAGSTNAYTYGTNLKTGYDWINLDNLQSGPQLGLNLNRISVKNFKEQGDRSTSMHFETHNKNDFSAALGWYVNSKEYQLGNVPANFRAELNYHQAIGSKDTKVRGAVNSTLTSFSRKLENPKKWLNLKADASFKISQASSINANLNFMTDSKKKNKKLSYGLGYRYKL